MSTPTNLVDDIIRYESGESTMLEALELHGALVRSGQAWSLQGHYGRTAAALIESGLLDEEGNLTDVALDRLAEVEEVATD